MFISHPGHLSTSRDGTFPPQVLLSHTLKRTISFFNLPDHPWIYKSPSTRRNNEFFSYSLQVTQYGPLKKILILKMYLTAWKIYLRYHPTEPIMWHFKYIVWRYISKLCNTPYEFILHIWHLSYLYYFPSVNSEFLDDFSVWTAYYQGLGQYNVEMWKRPECKVQGQLGPREYAVYGVGKVRIFQFMRHNFSCPQLHMGGRQSLPKFKAENTVTEAIRTCLHQKTARGNQLSPSVMWGRGHLVSLPTEASPRSSVHFLI